MVHAKDLVQPRSIFSSVVCCLSLKSGCWPSSYPSSVFVYSVGSTTYNRAETRLESLLPWAQTAAVSPLAVAYLADAIPLPVGLPAAAIPLAVAFLAAVPQLPGRLLAAAAPLPCWRVRAPVPLARANPRFSWPPLSVR